MNSQIIKSLVILLGFLVFSIPLAVAADNKTTKPNLFLLTSYQKHSDIKGWVMSEKFDGIRAYWNGEQLLTRNGNIIHAPNWFIKDFPSFELDGELWLGRGKYAETQAVVLDQIPSNDWKKITYQIFEVPTQKGDLFKRLEVLDLYLQKMPIQHIKMIKQISIENHHQVQNFLKKINELGGEGLVIRNPYLPYVTGRQASMQKVKVKQDAECKVVDYIEGKGKYKDMAGAIQCELLESQRKRLFPMLDQKTSVIKIGTGLSDLQRRVPPEIGSVITFQYMGLTKNGLPRFPVFLRERKPTNQ